MTPGTRHRIRGGRDPVADCDPHPGRGLDGRTLARRRRARSGFLAALLAGVLAAAVLDGTDARSEAAGDSVADTSMVFLVEAGNRMFPGWSEDHRVRPGEEFFIGDTAFRAWIAEFMPDFKIKDGKPFNFSDALENPAVHVYVRSDSATTDSTWAFLNFPPHFSPHSFFTFRLKEIFQHGNRIAGGESDQDAEQ